MVTARAPRWRPASHDCRSAGSLSFGAGAGLGNGHQSCKYSVEVSISGGGQPVVEPGRCTLVVVDSVVTSEGVPGNIHPVVGGEVNECRGAPVGDPLVGLACIDEHCQRWAWAWVGPDLR